MATGGMDYGINVDGNWEETLARFETRVDTLVGKLKKLKIPKGAGGESGGTSKGRGKATGPTSLSDLEKAQKNELASLAKKLNKIETDRVKIARKLEASYARQQAQLRKIDAQRARDISSVEKVEERGRVAAQKAQAAQAASLKATKDALNKQRSSQDVVTQASTRNLRVDKERAVQQAQITARMKATGESARKSAEYIGISAHRAKQLGFAIRDASTMAQQFLFTFRRLVGILAIFTLARKLAQGIGLAVKEMSRFNGELEKAEIGIAGIISSVGEVRNASGQLVTGAEAFAQSLEVSRGVLAQLKKDAVGSIATFEALVQSYQVAVGPGLAAGLDLDQVRVLSKRLAEGAITLGVPLNQLSEEIRSLLQGTATARNTRIAVLFGGAKEANEAIRNAKEQGNLYEVLTEKLQGVAQASDAASLSFNVLQSDLKDAIQLLLAEGGTEYFEQLKGSLLGLKGALTEALPDGGFIFRPEALSIVQEVGDTLASVIQSFRDITSTTKVLATLRNILGSIGDAARILAPVLSGIFQGLLDGVNTVLAPLRLLGVVFRQIAKAAGFQVANKSLAEILKIVTQIVVATFLWQKATLAIQALFGVKGMLLALPKIAFLIGEIGAGISLVAQATGLLAKVTAIWHLLLQGVQFTTIGILGPLALVLFAVAAIAAKFGLFDKLINLFTGGMKGANKEADKLGGFITSAGDATAEGAKSAEEWRKALRDVRLEAERAAALKGLEGTAKDLAGVFQDSLDNLTKQTRQFEQQRAIARGTLADLKEQKKVLETRVDTTSAERLGRVSEGYRLGQVGAGFGGAATAHVNSAQRKKATEDLSDNSAERLRIEAGIVAAREQIVETYENELKFLGERVKIFNEENRLSTRSLSESLKNAELERELADIRESGINVAARKLAESKAELAVTEAQIALTKAQNKEALDSLTGRISRSKQLGEELRTLYEEEVTSNKNAIEANKQRALAIQRSLTDGRASDSQIKELDNIGKAQAALIEKAKALEGAYVASNTQLSITKGLEEELVILTEAQRREEAKLAAQKDQAFRKDMRNQQLLAGSFTDALRIGTERFIEELPALGEQIADVVEGAFSDLAGVVGNSFKDAIDPRTDADLRTAFGEFFLDLAGSFVEALTSQLIAASVAKLIPTAGISEEGTEAGTEGLITSLQAGFMQLFGQLGGMFRSLGGVISGISKHAYDFGERIALASKDLLIAAGKFLYVAIKAAVSTFFAEGGLVPAFADGGQARKPVGLAKGGPPIPRPSYIPASDTVPAWLTPGEFVIKRESVRKYGLGVLTALNAGVLNPSSFANTARGLSNTARAVHHFASGGSVPRSTQTSSVTNNNTTQVLPILPVSEKTTDQILAGGRRALTDNVNQINVTGDPNSGRGW